MNREVLGCHWSIGSRTEPLRASLDGGGGTGGGTAISWYVWFPVGYEYGVSSDKNTGRLEIWEVVDSKSASRASQAPTQLIRSLFHSPECLLTSKESQFLCPLPLRVLQKRSDFLSDLLT